MVMVELIACRRKPCIAKEIDMIWKYEYKIAETDQNGNAYILNDCVQSLINEGWKPAGGMVQEHTEFDREDSNTIYHLYKYSQAMVKKQFILFYWLKKLFIGITKIIKPIPQV